jgi:hypothetical protein
MHCVPNSASTHVQVFIPSDAELVCRLMLCLQECRVGMHHQRRMASGLATLAATFASLAPSIHPLQLPPVFRKLVAPNYQQILLWDGNQVPKLSGRQTLHRSCLAEQ